MVYKSLGHPVPQREIFKAISVPDPTTGGMTCLSQLQYLDALARGLHTLYVREIKTIEVIRDCLKHSIRVLVHQRGEPNSTAGHFGVLVGIDEKYVYEHCSANGPLQLYTHNEILERLAPIEENGSVGLGNALLLISNPLIVKHVCKKCHSIIPEFITCLNCGKSIRLSPVGVLGCIQPECIEHTWLNIHCPFCFKGIRRLTDPKTETTTQENWRQIVKARQEKRDNMVKLFNLSK